MNDWISSADIIVTTTPSTTPLFPASYLKPGTHINLIGSWRKEMKEVGEDVVRRAGVVVVDSKEACIREAGEIGDSVEIKELGEVVRIDHESTACRMKPITQVLQSIKQKGDITIFKSVGLAIQDAAIVGVVVKKAEELGVGLRVDGYDHHDVDS
jgi:ornithine cyclodeaminase/alanine dehydrogenase-like protein (mu-crystallin family)